LQSEISATLCESRARVPTASANQQTTTSLFAPGQEGTTKTEPTLQGLKDGVQGIRKTAGLLLKMQKPSEKWSPGDATNAWE